MIPFMLLINNYFLFADTIFSLAADRFLENPFAFMYSRKKMNPYNAPRSQGLATLAKMDLCNHSSFCVFRDGYVGMDCLT